MRSVLGKGLSALGITLALAGGVYAAPITGQVDNFQDGTVQGWGGANVANVDGGAGGAGDRFLNVIADQPTGPGSRIGAFNGSTSWTGDYETAGVTGIQFDLANFGATDLDMRVMLFGVGGSFTSTIATTVPADGAWHTYTFGLSAADLTQVGGLGTLDQTLTAVDQVLIRHQPGAPLGPGQGVVVEGQLGIDNVTAIPEPATAALLGLVVVMLRRRA
ncbi:MAG: hypothetical protein KDA32_07770 [Phycisphaerales bacterium]|nr:hypothetical protein [Phycisphaerales bacterium]MCA9270975.1 hypothetical protein [Planctomycetales bacterium]